MKALLSSLAIVLLTSTYLQAKEIKNRPEKCNIYYNNKGRIYEGVDCRVWFDNGALSRVYFYLPLDRKWYDWSTKYSQVTHDDTYSECVRYTLPDGNQYQVCTQKTPKQLGI